MKLIKTLQTTNEMSELLVLWGFPTTELPKLGQPVHLEFDDEHPRFVKGLCQCTRDFGDDGKPLYECSLSARY